jgi:lysozyme
MKNNKQAIQLICKYEGYSESAYPDPETGGAPYTIGYGTQVYPDGVPVCAGQKCTKQKALQYLAHELEIIDKKLDTINLILDASMREALISFIHSIGWQSFLYSELIDCIANENWYGVAAEISRWIFDENYRVIGSLIDRRREEIKLFLAEVNSCPWSSTAVLLKAFRDYTAAPHQVKAIRHLEEAINPYVLADFANNYSLEEDPWELTEAEEKAVFAEDWE